MVCPKLQTRGLLGMRNLHWENSRASEGDDEPRLEITCPVFRRRQLKAHLGVNENVHLVESAYVTPALFWLFSNLNRDYLDGKILKSQKINLRSTKELLQNHCRSKSFLNLHRQMEV
jgi:hypothetical protein